MANNQDELFTGVRMGESVFDASGNELGVVRGVDRSGFYVLASGESDSAGLPMTDVRDITGTAYVMWRCWDCGEMGRLDDSLPETCPNCQAPKEELYYWAED